MTEHNLPAKSKRAQDDTQASSSSAQAKQSHGEILRSSAMIGASSALNIVVGMARTKAMAVMLGTNGFGLMSLYSSILDMAIAFAGIGTNNSGVRQIAEAAGSADQIRIARTAIVLRRTALVLGIMGAICVAAVAPIISDITFGNQNHTRSISLLGLAVFFSVIAGAYGALIQGLRRIGDLALVGVIGTSLGAIACVTFVYLLGKKGIAPGLACGAALSLLTAWWFSRKIEIGKPAISRTQVLREAAPLLQLGLAFMGSALLTLGASYLARIIVVREISLGAAGLYQAAWTLGGLYVGIILQSMAADFYPRLVSAAKDDTKCNRLVNEQTHVGLLLAAPGVIATLALAPLAIQIFYTAEFAQAVGILRWICLGIAIRVITWPMGYIIVAKGQKALFLSVDLAWTVVNVALTWACVRALGVNGAGVAFFISYVFHAFLVYPIVRSLSGFRWSRKTMATGALFACAITLVFFVVSELSTIQGSIFGSIVAIAAGTYSVRAILQMFAFEDLPRHVRKLVILFRAVRGTAR
jgi:PST family polysaccharide transporter